MEDNNNKQGLNTSGFTNPQGLNAELEQGMKSLSSAAFGEISPLYVSESGTAKLMTAVKYGKRYVLKGLKEEFRYSPVHRLALQKEFELGIRLDHPNIVRTIGFEEIDGLGPAIVLEYIDGATLETMIEKGGISTRTARSIVRQLADAMGYMHNKQVIHRDIKPSNIMVSHIGNHVKLIDFSLSDSEIYAIIKAQAGTRLYMAPELKDPEADSTVKTDIYSFGIVTGKLGEVAHDRKLLSLWRLCTKRDPTERPASFDELTLPLPQAATDSESRLFSLDSPKLTWLLSTIALILAALLSSLKFLYPGN